MFRAYAIRRFLPLILILPVIAALLAACDLLPAPPPPPASQATPSNSSLQATPTAAAVNSGTGTGTTDSADPGRDARQFRSTLALIPEQYEKSISSGIGGQRLRVIRPAEMEKARSLYQEAVAAFDRLRSGLQAANPDGAAELDQMLAGLDSQLADAASQKEVVAVGTIKARTNGIVARFDQVAPAAWLQSNQPSGFDEIRSLLDQLEEAVAAGQYDKAELLRLSAYSALEFGPEANMAAFAGHLIIPLESLFWYGQGEPRGLAYLIQTHAPLSEVQATRTELRQKLDEAEEALQGSSAAAAVATNAGIIVFREGLEAVLILASLLGSLKNGPNRRFRGPLSWGAAGAFGASAITWVLAQGILGAFAFLGVTLEAVVSLIAIGVLLLITNWFFHNAYWTGWIANFHSRKKRLMGAGISGDAAQVIGFALLGFTSIYREGFESVLFLQALVLEAGVGAVLVGLSVGLAGTLAIGVVVLALQAKLPYKKMLVATGIMIGGVLLIMVGNTVHVLQIVGWLPTHPIQALAEMPYWAGLWFGLYPTWEGIVLQALAGTFVIGSYFLAEQRRGHRAEAPQAEVAS